DPVGLRTQQLHREGPRVGFLVGQRHPGGEGAAVELPSGGRSGVTLDAASPIGTGRGAASTHRQQAHPQRGPPMPAPALAQVRPRPLATLLASPPTTSVPDRAPGRRPVPSRYRGHWATPLRSAPVARRRYPYVRRR